MKICPLSPKLWDYRWIPCLPRLFSVGIGNPDSGPRLTWRALCPPSTSVTCFLFSFFNEKKKKKQTLDNEVHLWNSLSFLSKFFSWTTYWQFPQVYFVIRSSNVLAWLAVLTLIPQVYIVVLLRTEGWFWYTRPQDLWQYLEVVLSVMTRAVGGHWHPVSSGQEWYLTASKCRAAALARLFFLNALL